MNKEDRSLYEILSKKMESLEEDYRKLQAVDKLIGSEATNLKKQEINAIISTLLDVKLDIFNEKLTTST